LMQRYADVVIAHFYGHEHIDEFRIIYSIDGRPLMPLLLAPALTPGGSDHNPGLRSFTYNRSTGSLVDMDQYYLNLTETMITDDPNWQLEYTFSETYGVNNISAVSLHKIASSMNEFSSPILMDYYVHVSAGYMSDFSECDNQCKRSLYCSVVAVDYSGYYVCMLDIELSTEPSAEMSSTSYNTSTLEPYRPHDHYLPRYIHIIIYVLVAVILLLCLFVAYLCLCRRFPLREPRYVLLT